MPKEENKILAKAAIEKEMETLGILLTAKVGRSALSLEEYINLRLVQGTTLKVIKTDLLADLKIGGRIFGEFKNALKPTFAGSIFRFRDVGALAEMGVETLYRWVAVLVNTCPDCVGRHGRTMLWDEWEEIGLPRTGATVCKESCKCVLIPKEATEMEPIMRKRKNG